MPYRLDEKTHKIYIDAPSVTTIVDLVYPFNKEAIPEKYLKMGQQKGTCVHKQIEMYIKFGIRTGCTCKKKVKTHIDQGKWLCDWWDEFKTTLEGDKNHYEIYNEKIMYSDTLKYVKKNDRGYFDNVRCELSGIADMIIYDCSDDETYIIDWKTTKEMHPEKEAIQVYLYGVLFQDWKDPAQEFVDCDFKYMIVNSNKKTSYELTPEQMEQGKQDALKGLQLYKEKKELWT